MANDLGPHARSGADSDPSRDPDADPGSSSGSSSRGALSTSQAFWRVERPEVLAALERHNRRIGALSQRVLHRLFVVYMLGPVSYLALRMLFRVQVSGADALDQMGSRAIFVFRHFYEWDPFVTFFGAAWTRALRRPHLHPNALGGQFWTRTRGRRVLSYLLGLIGVARGAGRGQSGLQRAGELLASGREVTVGIAPTGPIGRRREYEIRPGVAFLALDNPSVPVLPVTIVGLQHLRFRDVLSLRRPRLAIRFGRPFRAEEVAASDDDAHVGAIAERIRREWDLLEGEPAAHEVPARETAEPAAAGRASRVASPEPAGAAR